MLNRKDLEAKENWQATFLVTRTNKFECLMRTRYNNYYWHSVDYNGMFFDGATRSFNLELFKDAIDKGILKLVSGTMPSV